MARWFFLTVLALVLCYGQAQQTYKAVVVEYSPVNESTPLGTMLRNLDGYRRHVTSARDQGADIIIFPEYGLTTLVKYPKAYAVNISNANDTNSKVLTELSALAKEHSLYLVVNLLEKVQKQNKKTKYYNTNLVYDRIGEIIAKYRKIRLYKEPNLTPGNKTVTFYTDFGVTFGLMTGFDILYDYPSRTILNKPEVTDVVYPLAWYSTMPFHISLTVQHGYALANGVNLLAANYGEPSQGHGGSGIFYANGTVAELYIDSTPSSKRLIQDVSRIGRRQSTSTCVAARPFGLPGQSLGPNLTNYITQKDFDSSKFTFQKIDLSQQSISSKICHNQFCCNFSIIISQPANTSEIFQLAAYDGVVPFGDGKAHIRVCSLLACRNSAVSSCGERVNSTTTFTKITASGTFEKSNGTFYTPVSLKYGLQIVNSSTYCEQDAGNNKTRVQFSTLQSQNQVLVFGLYGVVAGGSASLQHFGFFFIGILSMIKIALF